MMVSQAAELTKCKLVASVGNQSTDTIFIKYTLNLDTLCDEFVSPETVSHKVVSVQSLSEMQVGFSTWILRERNGTESCHRG